MTEERLPEVLARLDLERAEADRRYNDALTALDRSLAAAPAVPAAPPPYDASKLADLNAAWDLLPSGAPPIDRSIKGRLRGLIWRMVGPPLEMQRHFNAALVDHLNRNAAAHQEGQAAIEATAAAVAAHADGLARMQGHLIQYLQTVTLYVDTRDRAAAGQVHVLNAGLDAIANDWQKRWESAAAPVNRLTAGVQALEQMRGAVALAQQTALTVKREVERLIDGSAPLPAARAATPTTAVTSPIDVNAFKYLGFEDAFRGSQAVIRGRLADYAARYDGLTDVLDIGCGRGEFLDLLRERGIPGRGLDLNHEMVEASRARGLAVEEGDALDYLRRQPDDSLGGIFSAQVVEHLQPDYLLALLDAAHAKIRPGGLIILETINPACWVAFFESYIRDLTHVRPIHPETLRYLLGASGFSPVAIEYRSPVDSAERLQPLLRPAGDSDPLQDEVIETLNANIEKLNGRMFTFQDYAAVGRKLA